MLVFIDDSGDAGFNLAKGSTRFFVIACVIFNDELEAEKTSIAIKELKRSLKFHDNKEFKFHSSNKDIREQFLRVINKFDFQIRALVIDKTAIRSKDLQANRKLFYSYAIKLVLQYSDNTILDAKVRIDGSGDRVFRKSFIAYLRREVNSRQRKIMKNCKLVDSKDNTLIQMADMVAGAVKRSYEVSLNDSKLYKLIIKRHIQDEWKFK